jgi:serine/threonine protein kinase
MSDALYKATFRLPWNNELKMKMAQQIADGMAYLHTTKPRITHGDLKPANVMLNVHNTCKIIDFGLAAVKESSPMVSNDPRIKADDGKLHSTIRLTCMRTPASCSGSVSSCSRPTFARCWRVTLKPPSSAASVPL